MTHGQVLMPPKGLKSAAKGLLIGDDVRDVMSRLKIPSKLGRLFEPFRYTTLHGGRGGAKSRTVAGVLTVLSVAAPKRILCAREYQTSIRDSVMELLEFQIRDMGLEERFRFGKTYIEGKNGSEFIFKGLQIKPDKIKSTEGIDYVWLEEAQRMSEASWTYLIPTIRKLGSRFFTCLNPEDADDPTYKRFVLNPPPDSLTIKVNWHDNPWFPDVLDQERRYCLSYDPDAYDWIWGGEPRKISDAQIFKGKYSVETFETPKDARFYHGADWGFAADPTVQIRCFERDKTLYVDQESYGLNLDLDLIADFWRKDIPDCDKWPIYADNSQPQTINHVKKFGFKLKPAKKWPGSVEDGIKFLRGFKQIVIHERCKHTAQEFKLYSYKTDRVTDEVLPIVVDKHNHCIDALRYAMTKRIKRKGGVF